MSLGRCVSSVVDQCIATRQAKVGGHHFSHQFLERGLGHPAQFFAGLALQPQQVFTDSDTVRVFPAPQLTTFYDTASATLCATDTMQLVYTWFNNGDTIHGVNGPCVQTDSTGAWWGVATNAFGCTASSDTIVVCPPVTIEANGTVLLVQGDFARRLSPACFACATTYPHLNQGANKAK